MAYMTVADAKTYIGGISGTGDDALLTDIIAEVQAFIERYCGRAFEITTPTDRYFDAVADTNGPWLYFDHVAASISGVYNGDSAETEVLSTEYVLSPRNFSPYYAIKLLSSSGKVWEYTDDPEGAIKVNAYWGHSTTPPDDILLAAKDIVRRVYRQRDAIQDVDIIAGGIVVTSEVMSKGTKRLLDMYRNLS